MNAADHSSSLEPSNFDPLDQGLAAAFGGEARTTLPHSSVLKTLQARTNSKLGVHLESQGLEDAPVKVTEEVRALRDPSGRYQVLGEIGRGGMGIVYKGRDQDLGRDVAMKVLKDEYAARADVLARFVEEAQIGGQLQHPGIVPVYELGLQSGERPYFAMKLVKGETLAAKLAKRGSPSDERRRLLGIFEQVCQTVAYAHARRVVHRDLKPANVMIGAFGEVQVVDWGFAKVLQKGALDGTAASKRVEQLSVIDTARSRADSGSHSVAGSMMGTPAYMPPEQALGDIARVDERSDVFALGAILCEILSGDAPYREQDGDLVRQAANAQLDGAHERLAKCGADEALITLSRECLSPSQRARPSSAAELAERVSTYLTSVEERARQAQVRAAEARLKHRVTLMSAGAGVLVLALGAAGWIWIDAQARARRAEATQRVASAMSVASGARGRAQSAGLDPSLWSTAVASAEQLASLAVSDDVDATARADAEVLLANVQEESRAADAESERLARDARMLAQLEAARIPADEDVRENALNELRRLDAAYAQAFAEYLGGTSLFEQPSGTALASLRGGSIALELAGSLDHWGLVRDSLRQEDDAPDPSGTARIREIALQLDAGDPWRTQLRALLPNATDAKVRLRELADQADFAVLTAVGCRVLGQALWRAGEQEASVAVLRRGQELHPRDFGLCFQLALCLDVLEKPRPEEAFEVYRIAHAIRPELNEVLHRQVLDLEALGRHADAERVSRLLIAREPLDAHWLDHLGTALDEQGRLEEAIECARKQVELQPTGHLGHSNLGFELGRSGQLEEAIASYRTAIELDPNVALSHFGLGCVLEKQGRSEEAIACYRKTIELDPKLAKAHVNLGTMLSGRGELDEAVASYRKGLELDPKDEYGHRGLGLALEAQGQLDEAIASFRRVLELWSGDTTSLAGIGRANWKQGHLDQALECFQRIAELDPRHAPTRISIGQLFANKRDFERALEQFREAAALSAQDPLGREWLEQSRRCIAETEKLIAQGGALQEVLEGRAAFSMDEWNAAVQFGYDQKRYREVLALTETTLSDAPELIGGMYGAYFPACVAALLAADEAASMSTNERVRLREQARAWLTREVERWISSVEQVAADASDGRTMLNHVQGDPDLASVRGAAIGVLPEDERAAWRALWKRVEEGARK